MIINYQEVDSNLRNVIGDKYGEMAKNHIHLEEGSFSLAAMYDGVPVGFISAYTKTLPIPLDGTKDAYIDIIEVDEQFRRQGVARHMINATEKWASGKGFSQIRSWSSRDKTEAISMWLNLKYGMCPAKIWIERIKEAVNGYYVVKTLKPKAIITTLSPEQEEAKGYWYAYIYEQNIIQPEEVAFIIDSIGKAPQKVLEVACGGGRILAPIAGAGHTATGFDMDKYMLERCRMKIRGMDNAQCYYSNALADNWGSGYDVVVLAANILINIVADGDYAKAQKLFIEKAAAALKQGGHLYVGCDCFDRSASNSNKEWTVFEGVDDRGTYGKYIVVGGEYDPVTRMDKRSLRRFEITPATGEPFSYTYEWCKHFPTLEQIHGWLADAGFGIEWEYGGYDRRPINESIYGNKAVIWACKK